MIMFRVLGFGSWKEKKMTGSRPSSNNAMESKLSTRPIMARYSEVALEDTLYPKQTFFS